MQPALKAVCGYTCFLFLMLLAVRPCVAGEELITTAKMKNGDSVPYVLNTANGTPHYVLILFPGGAGIVDPHMEVGKLVYKAQTNFLLRARPFIVDDDFATVATNSTQSEERIQALLDDLKSRFPAAKIYLMGTSRGTYDTMALAGYLSDKIAGEIHTSSMSRIAVFNAKQYGNRQLIVHHRNDGCRQTSPASAQASQDRYGSELILMDGGVSFGDPCEAYAYHGYNGIEKQTVDAIKEWVRQGG